MVTVEAKSVAEEHKAVRFAIYRMALKGAGLDVARLQLCHIAAIDDLVTRGALGKSYDLPDGYTARIDHGGLAFGVQKQREPLFEAPFSYPFEKLIGDRKLIVTQEGEIGDAAALDPRKTPEDALFRTRRPGDFLRPKNFKGRKKLKTFLIDRKIPSGIRDFMPLLAVGSEVLWVPGLFLAPPITADKESENIVKLLWDSR